MPSSEGSANQNCSRMPLYTYQDGYRPKARQVLGKTGVGTVGTRGGAPRGKQPAVLHPLPTERTAHPHSRGAPLSAASSVRSAGQVALGSGVASWDTCVHFCGGMLLSHKGERSADTYRVTPRTPENTAPSKRGQTQNLFPDGTVRKCSE